MINKNLHSKGRTLQSSRLATMTSSFIENQNQNNTSHQLQNFNFSHSTVFSTTNGGHIHNVKLQLKTPRPQIVVKKKILLTK